MFKGGESNLTSVLFHYYLQLLNKRLFRRDTAADVLDPGVLMCQPVPEAAEQQTAHTDMLYLQLIVL